MTLTLARKGLILLAVPFALLLALLGLVAALERDTAEAQAWELHTRDVVNQTQQAMTHLLDAQGAVRGYVVTGDASFLPPYDAAAGRWRADLDALAELVRDSPTQAARVVTIRGLAEGIVGWLVATVEQVRGGDAAGAVERVRGRVGDRQAAALRAEVAAFLAEEDRLDRERGDAVKQARRRLWVFLVAGGATAAVVAAALAAAFHRTVTRRVAVLVETTRRLAAGAEPGAPLAGADEFTRVDAAVRAMAAELQHTAGLLRSAAAEVRDLYDHAPCGYHSVGPDGVVVAMNSTELRWLGYAAADVVGRLRFADAVAPVSRAAYAGAFTTVRDHGGVTDVEVELVRRDGTTFPVLLNSSGIRTPDGRFLRSRTTLTDLTARRRAEDEIRRLNAELEERVRARTAELRRSEQRYRSFVAATAQVVWITDPTGELHGDTAEWEAYTGQTAAEARGFGWMAAVRADDRERVVEAWRRAVAAGTSYEVEYHLRVADGGWRQVHARGVPVLDPDGRVGEWVGTCIDVTARREAEAAVRRRTAELEEANRELAHKNAENEMFVYSVSHDLRGPLVNLQGFAAELDKGCRRVAALLADPAVPAAVRDPATEVLGGRMDKALGFIRAAVLRLSGIIEALLRLSRAGRVEYRCEAVDVAAVVARVVASLDGTVTTRGASVAAGELPPAWGDPTALEQVFANLIGNALTYLDPARPGRVEVGCLPETTDGLRTYYVRDNGRGIAEAHRGKIFQVFQRAHPEVPGGEGIGLAVVTRVAERHRGRVWVESEAGAGSTFFVALPAAPAGGG